MQSRTRSLRTLMGLTLSLSLITCSDGTGPSPTPSSVASAQGNAQTATVGQLLGAGLAVLVNGSDGQPFEGAGVTWPSAIEVLARHASRMIEAIMVAQASGVRIPRPG